MSILNLFNKKPLSVTDETTEPQEQDEEYIVDTFQPRKVPMTTELLMRQREEEMRKKYCHNSVKTGVLL